MPRRYQQQVSNISALSPVYNSNLQLVVGGKNTNAQVTGVMPQYFQVTNLQIASGDSFTDQDYTQGARYAVIGSNVATTLFPNSDPIGQQMRMGRLSCALSACW